MSDTIQTAEGILRRLKDAGIPQSVIAKKLALSQSAVSNLFNGTRRLQFNEAQIMMAMLPSAPLPTTQVPVIGMAGAGRWLEAIEEARSTITIPAEVNATGRFAVEVIGDSMNLMLPEGSFALIDPDETSVFVGKLYLLRNSAGEATIKRYRSDPARFEPVSDNPEHRAFEVGSSDFHVIGRVTAGVQSF